MTTHIVRTSTLNVGDAAYADFSRYGRITVKTGYVISFKNGYDLSVAFGPGNYCSNRQETTLKGCRGADGRFVQSITAEAIVFLTGCNDAFNMKGMVIPGVEDYVRMGDGSGLSWASPEHIAALTAFVAALPMRADWKD